MKKIIRYILGILLGAFLSFIIVIFLFAGLFSVLLSSSEKSVQLKPQTVLHLSFDYPIPERTSDNPFEHFNFQDFSMQRHPGTNDIKKAIRHAAQDPNIEGIFLDCNFVPANLSTVQQIREELKKFKESGKFILSHSDFYAQNAYYLASVSDKIFLTPQGILQFNGLHWNVMYISGALEKAGIEAQVFTGADNRFKSAVEPYVRKEMSDESRQQTSRFVQGIWDLMLEDIATSRDISSRDLNQIADHFSIAPTDKLISLNLIDGFRYRDEVLDSIRVLVGMSPSEKIRSVSLSNYFTTVKDKPVSRFVSERIAVVYATGEMVPGKQQDGQDMSAETLAQDIRKIRNDSSYKALVLRINSGGGSALAAEILWREVMLASERMPVIASFSDYAASGAYYMAVPAHMIFATPMTLTGSIGVFGVIPNTQQLFNEKLGITFDGIKTNQYADILSIHRPVTEQERSLVDEMINNTYKTFKEKVSAGRAINISQVEELAKGQVWLAGDALKSDLVDSIGDLDDALTAAARRIGLTEYHIDEYPRQEVNIKSMFSLMGSSLRQSIVSRELGDFAKHWNAFSRIRNMEMIQARMPFELIVE